MFHFDACNVRSEWRGGSHNFKILALALLYYRLYIIILLYTVAALNVFIKRNSHGVMQDFARSRRILWMASSGQKVDSKLPEISWKKHV